MESKKKGYTARVKELNTKAKAAEEKAAKAEEKAESLAEKLAELTRAESPQDQNIPQGIPEPTYNPQEPIVAEGEEITGTELNKRLSQRETNILKQAESIAELKRRQGEAVNRINNEAEGAIRKYSELDPESDTFNPKLSKSVTKAVEAHVKANPYSASVKEFVDELMDAYQGVVAEADGKASEKVAKQVSQAALRPSGIRKGEKPAQEKSIKELEEELGIVQA